MTAVKAGAYLAGLVSLGTILNAGYEANAWSADIKTIQNSQQVSSYEFEKRILTRSIFSWRMKPAPTPADKRYHDAMIKQLESEQNDVKVKLRSIR